MPYGQIAMQPVEQTARPRPVRGAVVEVAVAQKVVGVVDAVVAEHVAMCMQHTLRIPGGARCVHEEQRILRLRCAIRRELRGAFREQVVEIDAVHACSPPRPAALPPQTITCFSVATASRTPSSLATVSGSMRIAFAELFSSRY